MRNAECGIRTVRDCTRTPLFRIPNSEFRTSATRRSFTLVELMVVITIIAILATISLQVVGGLIGQARDAATRATISKIQGLLNSRSQALDRLIKRKGYLTGTQEFKKVQLNYGAAASQQSTKLMLTTKILQAKFFPQRYQEVYDPNIYRDSSGSTPIAQSTA